MQQFLDIESGRKKTQPTYTQQWARAKKTLMKSNKSISRKKTFFYQIPFIAISKMTKNQFFNWKKKV